MSPASTLAGQARAVLTGEFYHVSELDPAAAPLAATRGEDGRWIGGSARQWVDELTTAVRDHHAAGFIYRNADDTPADEALARWATEIVPPSAKQSPDGP
jgi:hypothetical protein